MGESVGRGRRQEGEKVSCSGARKGRRRERLSRARLISARYSFCYLFRAGECDGEIAPQDTVGKGSPYRPRLGGH